MPFCGDAEQRLAELSAARSRPLRVQKTCIFLLQSTYYPVYIRTVPKLSMAHTFTREEQKTGGKNRAKRMSKRQRSESARIAVQARWAKAKAERKSAA